MDRDSQAALLAKVRTMMDGDYHIADTSKIPSVEEVSLGRSAVRCNAVAFSIDLRNSSEILDSHHKQTAGKIHKAFLHIVASWAEYHGGAIRNYTGDGLLAFWPRDEADVGSIVDAALHLNDYLRKQAASVFEKYRPIDFGIGLAAGSVVVFRAGLPGGGRNSDLVFIGECVNLAVKMAKKARSPSPVWITEAIHDALPVDLQLGDPDAIIFDEPHWEEDTFEFGGESVHARKYVGDLTWD